MARQGEYCYYQNIGEAGVRHSLDKPFSDEKRGSRLMEVGAVLSLLPPPPARILECGCGVGWFAWVLAKSGYDVVAQDVSSNAIQLAQEHPLFTHSPAPRFVASDFEDLEYANEFEAVVFFDSLHHAIEETEAIRAAWRALRPGGRMIASEPGVGHAKAAREVVREYDVTDKDMPPSRIVRLGKQTGFRSARIYPHADCLGAAVYGRRGIAAWAYALWHLVFRRRNGIAVLVK
jgi:SAM-dependent methyltransferase